MQHHFEFICQAKDQEEPIRAVFTSQSSRYRNVMERVIKGLNKLRKEAGLTPWQEGDLTDFRLRKLN